MMNVSIMNDVTGFAILATLLEMANNEFFAKAIKTGMTNTGRSLTMVAWRTRLRFALADVLRLEKVLIG